MRTLLDGNPHLEIELARSAGYTRVSTIQRWIRSFETARFITRKPADVRGEYVCQLRTTRDAVRKIYNFPEFRQIRPLIREAPWFSPIFGDNFASLPGDLPRIIDRMVKKSHTFFEIIDKYDTPEKIREIYHPAVYVNEMRGIKDEEFNAWCLYYQIYIHSIIRDISGGGLGEGFMDLVNEMQDQIGVLQAGQGGVRHGNR
jgi:hypothetical protein